MHTRLQRISLTLLGLYAASLAYIEISRRMGLPPIPPLVNIWFTVCIMGAALASACEVLGVRRSLLFWAVTTVLAWSAEQAGVATGLIFGHYHYTDMAGPQLGLVPVVIPAGWFMMLYPSHVIATLCVHGKNTVAPRSFGHAATLALLTALIMTAWDLVVDPGAARAGGQWVWEQGGAYFGVPIHNYIGWIATSFVVALFWRVWEMRKGIPTTPPPTRAATLLPLGVYAVVALGSMQFTGMPQVALVGCFSMGIPLLIALLRTGQVDTIDQRGTADAR